ncbi:MAG: hypothetical protein VCA34_06695 [Roseibacillus sp.]
MRISALLLSLLPVLGAQAAGPQTAEPVRPDLAIHAPATQAVISGVERNGIYPCLPPVLVELSALPGAAVVWVEVKRGGAEGALPALAVNSEFYLRRDGMAVLTIPGLHRACKSGGTWTVSVLMSDASGTTSLASTTFLLQAAGAIEIGLAAPAAGPGA